MTLPYLIPTAISSSVRATLHRPAKPEAIRRQESGVDVLVEVRLVALTARM